MITPQLDGIGDDLIISSGAGMADPVFQPSDPASQELHLAQARTEIVFIEDNVADYQSLARQLGNGREVVILDSTKDGVHQIADALAGRTGIDALHIISHGSAGSANLGALTLDAANAGEHQADLNAIGRSMVKGGDILLYGCDTGAGPQGQAFVDELAIATGADVAASNDLTGSAALGGDWQLEVTSGPVETAGLAPEQYGEVLSLSNVNIDFQSVPGFSGSATQNLLYTLPGNSTYQLQVHSPSAAYATQDSSTNYSASGIFYPSQPMELSFTNGDSFSISSIALGVSYEGLGYSYTPEHTTVTISGVDANGNTVDSKTVTLTADPGGPVVQYQTITFSGMTNIKTLKIDEASGMQYTNRLFVDNLAINNVQGADTTPPTTTNASVAFSNDTGTSNSDLITKTAAQTISGTLSANLASDEHVEVSLDNGAHWTTATATVGTNSWSLGATLTASGTLKVRVVDSSGNAGTADSHAYTLDTSAPATSSTPLLDPASDTGISHSDGITADTTPTFTGTAEAGATVKLYEGSTLLGSAVATGGNWSITSTALGEGQHTVTTTVLDAAGNVSGASSGLTFTVDTTAPTTTVAGIVFSADNGSSGTDFVTNVAAQTISGTLSAALQTGEHVEVSLDNGANWTTAQVSGTTWSLATTLGGSGTLQVRVADAVDNTGPVATQAYVLDTSAPTVTIGSDASALKIGDTATITFTFSEDPGASFSWDGTQGDVAVSGGTLSAISGTGTTRTAIFTPDANTNGGTAGITVTAGSYADAAGNNGGAGTTPSIHFDTLAPNTPSTPQLATASDTGASSADGITHATTPTFTGTAEAGATVTLYDTDGTTVLGSAVATGGTWSIGTSTLSDGQHTITAKATDAAGNASGASSGATVTIDTTAPAAPSAPVPGAAITSDTTPTFTGTAAAGAHVDLYDTNGTTVLGSTTADGNGAWTITATSMGEGTHTVTAKATDVAGNASTASASNGVTIDATAPATSSTPLLDPASDTGISHSDGITADTTPTFTGTAEAGATVKLYEGSTLLGSAVATGGNWSITSTALGEGQHTVTTTVLDAAGNVSGASSGLTFTVDTTAPTTTVAGIVFSADNGSSGTDFVTNVAAQTISGTLSAALQTGEHVEVSLDNGANWTTAQVSGTTWSLATTLGGSGTLQVRVADAVDNTGPVATQAYVLDTSAPTVTIGSDASALKIGDTATITFTFSEDPGASFSWDGTQGDVAVSGGTLSAISGTGTTRTAIFTPDANTNGGTAGITVTAGSYADAAGNNGGAGTTPSIHFDTLAPNTPSTPQLATASDTGASSADGITHATTPTFTGTAEAGATVTLYDTDGTTVLGSAVATGGTWSIGTSTLSEGQHTITAKATDAAGNASGASSGATVTIDTAAPTVAIGSDASALKAGETATITFTFGEDPGASFSWDGTHGDVVVTGGTLSAISGTGTVRTAVFTPDADTNGGTAGITVAAGSYADTAGNNGGAGATPSLHFDTLAPVASSTPDLDSGSDTGLSHSDDITADTTPTFTGTAEDGATVKLYEGSTLLGSNVATGGTWSITSTALGDGQHTVTTTVTDAAGNVSGASNGLTFTVDTTAPTTTVGVIAFSADNGSSGTDFITNVAAQTISGSLSAALQTGERVEVSLDNGANWTTAQVSGTTWSLAATLAATLGGSGTLQVRVGDALGNAGPAHTQAYVLDTSAPTVTIGSDASALKIGETALITFTFSEDPGASFSWDGTQGDVAVSGGTLSVISGTGTTRTAIFTPDAHTNGGTASITVTAGSYADAAGNDGSAGAPPSLHFDTLAPDAPAAQLQAASDTGASSADGITSDATPTVSGTAEAHAAVTLYDGDGTTVLGTATADGAGAWSITSAALADGGHLLRATQADVAGNVSARGAALAVTVDTAAPAQAAAPVLAGASDSGIVGDHITRVATPTFGGTAEALSQVTLYDTDGQTALGSVRADADGKWSITTSVLADGEHTLAIRQVDAAGNESGAGIAFTLTVDTAAPAAPAAPQLQAQSDTGTKGDGVTYAVPVLQGSAAANDLVTLYDGTTAVGTAHADANSHWSLAAQALGLGHHTLSVTDTDAAGNVSAPSGSLALTVEAAPVPLVDGVRVVTMPVVLADGASGSQVQIPIVSADRVESIGTASTADIPLASGAGTDLLVAHVAAGYGLTASGGPNTTVANGSAALIAAIQAATASDTSGDQSHMTGNGQSYLAQLASGHSLLVQTIAPVSGADASGVLTLSANTDAQQHVALVIQAGGQAPGSTIALQNIEFAAIVGAANVVVQGGTQMLTGDAASQHFTLAAGGSAQAFAGGGDDTMTFGVPTTAASASGAVRAQAAPATTLLHGGAGDDTAVFNGARAAFDIETHNGYLVVSSKAAPQAQAMVVNVEHLQFSDATIAVEDGADLTPLTGLYQAVLGRQADVYGLDFWAGVHDKGISLGTIAVNMIGSAERLATQGGFNGDAAHDVGLLYAGLFDRAADTAGLAYWTAAMQHGATLAQVADAMLQSVEMVGQQGTPLDWNFGV
jgi:predicted secreted protein